MLCVPQGGTYNENHNMISSRNKNNVFLFLQENNVLGTHKIFLTKVLLMCTATYVFYEK